MTVNCLICTKQFTTYPSKIKLGKGKYCSKACQFESQKGKQVSPHTQFKKGVKPHNYKGYRFVKSRKNGRTYKLIHKPDHPYATKAGYVREHRLVMEKHIGRYLTKDEVVHHIDENTTNNDISNLQLMTPSDHSKHHISKRHPKKK